MNVAFLMLTSAALAGADPAPAAPPHAAAPAVVSTGSGCGGCGGCGSTCGSTCGDACDTCGHHRHHLDLFGKLHGLFHRGHGDCGCADACAPACPAPCAPVCKPACPAPCAPVCKPACPAPCAPVCADACDPCAHHHWKPFSRLHGLFHRGHGDCGCGETCGSSCGSACGGCGGCGGAIAAPAVAPVAPPAQKMPTTIGSAGTIITPARIGIETEGAKNPFDLHRRYEGRVSHAHDYSKLTGQLFFVHTDGGRWVLRYSPISKEDRFGGSVVLARDLNMDGFNEGDLVSVEGEVLAEKSGSPLGGALYRAAKTNLVDRGVNDLPR